MMDAATLETVLAAILRSATPLILLGVGIIVSERAGILNLGQEGMLTSGAAVAFVTMLSTASPTLSITAAALAGMTMAGIFAVPVLALKTNQVATGLALTLFGLGLAALLGNDHAGASIEAMAALPVPGLHHIPIAGVLFDQDLLVYVGWLMAGLVAWFLRTHPGTVIIACGHAPAVLHTMGHPVLRIQALATLFGGAMAGLAGAYLALSFTPLWSESIGNGRGWIALALVVFASHQVGRLVLGAAIFGSTSVLQLVFQAAEVNVSTHLLAASPYLVTIIALVVLSRLSTSSPRLQAPRTLGQTMS